MLKPSQIEDRVRDLLRRLRIKGPSVPVRVIAEGLGASVRDADFDDDTSGVLTRRSGAPVIGVNASHHPVRQRFTIAHEIGHLVLHSDALHVDAGHQLGVLPPAPLRRDARSSQAVDYREIEANRFAAALLMPEDFILRDLKGEPQPVSPDKLAELAKAYEVSRQAITFRLTNLGIPVETTYDES